MGSDHGAGKGDAVHRLASNIYRLRVFVLVFWLLLTVVMVPYSWQLILRAAPMVKHPPPGTASAAAMGEFEEHFANFSTLRREMVSFRCRESCESAASILTEGWVTQLTDMVGHFEKEHPGSIMQVHSYYSFSGHHQLGKNIMISEDKQSILFLWVWRVPGKMKEHAEAFCRKVSRAVDGFNAFQPDDGMEVAATGLVFLDSAMKDTLIEEIPVHEVSTIWLPFIILALALRSPRMLLVALVPMPIEIFVSFGLMYFVSLQTPVVLFALMMMLMLCTSLSFDYSLFSLTRYAEERAAGETVEDAVVTVISQSGRVIVVSGFVLCIAWGAMLGLPSPFNGFCIAACSMIIVCVGVQLTFVPCVIAVMPFLGPSAGEKRQTREMEISEDNAKPLARGAHGAEHGDPMVKARPHMRGFWFWLGGTLTRSPLNIIISVCVYLCMMPLTMRMSKNFDFRHFKFKMGHSYELTMPRTAMEWKTLMQIQEDFPSQAGILMPMLIMMTNSDPNTGIQEPFNVEGQAIFDLNCHMVDSLLQATQGKRYEMGPSNFLSATVDPQSQNTDSVKCLNAWAMKKVRTSALSKYILLSHTSKHLQELWDQLVSSDHHAMLTFMFPVMDPFSPEAFQLVTDVRAALDKEAELWRPSHPGLKFETFSPGSVLMDLIDVTSSQLPVCFAGCAMVCLTLIGIWFHSYCLPFKLLLTVVVPITWTYGAGLYVYEDGWLAWTGIPGLTPVGEAGIDWTVPMFTLTFMMGLALDYEIFLFERVKEFREEGFGDREAIQLGLSATGTTISAAGLIMALTFLAQLLGSIPVTNQMGFVLVFSIVVDTFIVRSILVPAMLSLVPCSNYYPSQMPEPLPQCQWLEREEAGRSSSSKKRRDPPTEEEDEDDSDTVE